MCRVWKDTIGLRDITIWVLIVGAPIVMGPVCTMILEFLFLLKHTISQVSNEDPITRPEQQILVTALAVLVTVSYSTNLLVTEKYFTPIFELNQFTSLILKYFLGYIDVILAPIIICLVDTKIRQGISIIFNRKRTRSVAGSIT